MRKMRDMGELAMYFFNLENGRTESENEQKCQKKKKLDVKLEN